MTEVLPPVVLPGEPTFAELRQVTITEDEQVTLVNQLLAEGWRLVSIGFRADATVYVLGRLGDRPKPRAGFLASE
jgi:hypothetical protein